MNTKFPVVLVLVIGASVLIFQLSGAVALLDNTSARNFDSGAIVQDQNGNYSIENESAYGGQVNAEADSNIAGVIIGSIPRMLGLLAVPGILGSELQTLTPAPWYVAQPIGGLFNIIVYIGGFQIVTGRYFE
jgi:hypothetical protein